MNSLRQGFYISKKNIYIYVYKKIPIQAHTLTQAFTAYTHTHSREISANHQSHLTHPSLNTRNTLTIYFLVTQMVLLHLEKSVM